MVNKMLTGSGFMKHDIETNVQSTSGRDISIHQVYLLAILEHQSRLTNTPLTTRIRHGQSEACMESSGQPAFWDVVLVRRIAGTTDGPGDEEVVLE